MEIARREATGADAAEIAQKRALLAKIDSFAEANPMLGMRGCRLSIMFPILPVLQVRAIATAAAQLKKEGLDPKPEVMIPLVSTVKELDKLRAVAEQVIAEVAEEQGVELDIEIGTMIELPRAALTADEIAEEAEFFSFGTNDLTQLTFGFSRDDTGKMIKEYKEKGIFKEDPFQSIDEDGVGWLVETGTKKGRAVRPGIHLGICGEHGGDPKSIEFCDRIGLNYVSCSPFRVPAARLAAAQARIKRLLDGSEKGC